MSAGGDVSFVEVMRILGEHRKRLFSVTASPRVRDESMLKTETRALILEGVIEDYAIGDGEASNGLGYDNIDPVIWQKMMAELKAEPIMKHIYISDTVSEVTHFGQATSKTFCSWTARWVQPS